MDQINWVYEGKCKNGTFAFLIEVTLKLPSRCILQCKIELSKCFHLKQLQFKQRQYSASKFLGETKRQWNSSKPESVEREPNTLRFTLGRCS